MTAVSSRQEEQFPHGGRRALVVDDDDMVAELVRLGLETQGIEVVTAADGHEAEERLTEMVPDVVVSDINMPRMDGFALVSRLRADPLTRNVPLIFLTSLDSSEDVARGLRLGADDYVRKPFLLDEVVARVVAKLDRPTVSVDTMLHDVRTGLLGRAAMENEVRREIERVRRTGRPSALALIDVDERALLRERLGQRAEEELAIQVAEAVTNAASPLDRLGRDEAGRLLFLVSDEDEPGIRTRLRNLAEGLAGHRLVVAGEAVRVTPVVGWVSLDEGSAELTGAEVLERALTAADAASMHLDLQPVRWSSDLVHTEPRQPGGLRRRLSALRATLRTPLQVLLSLLLGIVAPFFLYAGLYLLGLDVSGVMYFAVVAALLVTAASIWAEGFYALKPDRPPEQPSTPYPAASAVIAAYLPNEAATIVETAEAFLRQDYPADLQVIVAYNTPRPLPVEKTLREIAARDPRLVPYKVEGSTSKAQNVNAALAQVTGEFVGVFDADHHPDVTSFRRAWRWLSSGYDVVQGHCLIRNGDASWVARTNAVEFESIYAVSHPGRARLHRFGVFGGSNGYWRTNLLRMIRMHGSMLTEDIDSSLRVVESGGRIANDPGLISRELAPTTLKALWNQRMRWAQGWFQVSMKHMPRAWRSDALTLRQKLGMSFLLGWREVYPWISLQMFPLLGFLAWREGGVANLDWLIPLFVLSTLFTLSVGPGQTVFARKLGAPEIKRQRFWFLRYLFVSSLFYTEFKNIIARVAQFKEFSGEREWKVTPRPVSDPTPETDDD